jgi:hypothetical protein
MNRNLKRLLAFRGGELSRQVTAERARRGGVVLGEDLRLQHDKSRPRTRYPQSVVKTLAGG